MPNIYQLDQQFQSALDLFEQGFTEVVDTESGEIKSLVEYMEELQATKQEKIDNLAKYVKNTTTFIADLKQAKKELDERIKAKQARLDNAMEYLKEVTNGKKIETVDYVISYRKSEAVEIKEGASIPKEFLIPQEPKADKKALKKAMKNGAVFEGISLVEKVNMSVK